MKLGLKIWSTDISLANEAGALVSEGVYSYIELFSVPGSFRETASVWKRLGVPFVIHAPHSIKGLNPAKRELESANRGLAFEALRFADELSAGSVIFHPGLDGPVQESIRQLKGFGDDRVVVENKPRDGLNGGTCVGWSCDEVKEILEATGFRFCLDFGHAHSAAVSAERNPRAFIDEFLKLKPAMFHMTDGDARSKRDRHDRYGFGSLPLGSFIDSLPAEAMVTNEGARSLSGLSEPRGDASFIAAFIALRKDFPRFEMKRAREIDTQRIFELSNSPDVRAVSFTTDPIRYEEHLAWFSKKLADKDCRYFVFLDGETLAGQVRFQRIEGGTFETGISVDPSYRGTGASRAFMKASMNAASGEGVETVVAKVKLNNQASLRFFSELGFSQTAKTFETRQGSTEFILTIGESQTIH